MTLSPLYKVTTPGSAHHVTTRLQLPSPFAGLIQGPEREPQLGQRCPRMCKRARLDDDFGLAEHRLEQNNNLHTATTQSLRVQ